MGVVWGHLVAALLYVAGSLQHLELETSGPLVISQWAAALTQVGCQEGPGSAVHPATHCILGPALLHATHPCATGLAGAGPCKQRLPGRRPTPTAAAELPPRLLLACSCARRASLAGRCS